MKILCFIDSLGSGGAQRQIVELAKGLKERGHEVSLLVYHREDFFKNKLDEFSIHIHYIIEKQFVFRIWKIRKFIRNGGYDAVISFLDVPNFINCASAIGGKSWKVITSERSSKVANFLSYRGKIFGWFQRFSDNIICNSNNAKLLWEKYYPKYINKLDVIYNAVVIPKITIEYIPKKNDKINILVAASYQEIKNPIGMIKAVSQLNPNMRSRISINWYGEKNVSNGGDKIFKECQKLVAEYNLENSVCLNSVTKEILVKMKSADIVAIFSEYEGLPNAICEGMMIGKPIIMTKVSDFYTLVDESNGFLCDWNKTESIKQVFEKAINLDENTLIKMGNASKEKAVRLFSQNTIMNQFFIIL